MAIENQETSSDRSIQPQHLQSLEYDNEIQHMLDASLSPRQTSLRDIAPYAIEPNPFQPRKHFDEQALQELALSLRTYGLLSRIRVRPHPTRDGIFQLVYGERRLRASRLAGLPMIPCEVALYTDDELKDIGLIENIQRQDLTPLEEATMFRQLLDEKNSSNSIRKLAAKIGKDKSYVEIRLALLELPSDVRQLLEEQPKVSLRALVEIAKLPMPEVREPLIQQLQTGMLSTEAIRTIVREVLNRLKKSASQAAVNEADPLIFERTFYKASRRLQSALDEFRKVKDLYAGDPDPTKKQKLSEYLHQLQQEARHIEELLS